MWPRRRVGGSPPRYKPSFDRDHSANFPVRTMRFLRLRVTRLLGIGLPSRRRNLVLSIVAFLLLLVVIRYFTQDELNWDLLGVGESGRSMRDPSLRADKWIVITTINFPTEAVRALSEQPGWRMVVVGDRKTPVSWNLPNVIYLDLRAQKALGYRVLRYLPLDSYTRKTIGYLYAIEHGAKHVYETDDDNFPEYGISGGAFQVTSSDTMARLVLDTTNLTNNPYVHFGQSTIWPRGYPLDRVGLPADRRYNICVVPSPPIQLGVVNGDPDVDAIFRLSRRRKPDPLRLTFDHAAPPYVLPPRTFAPFNSQNTFFSTRAFWSMVLPVSFHDRAVDIYRTYWAQRLLWLIGDGVAFAPPSTVQVRNQHSDLADAAAESSMYQEMGRYIEVLNEWECGDDAQFMFECISRLSRHLVDKGFWKSRDADIVDAWLSDLSSIGYAPPILAAQSTPPRICTTDPKMRTGNRVVFHPVEQNTSFPHTAELMLPPGTTNHELVAQSVASLCGLTHSAYFLSALRLAKTYPNILLVIGVQEDLPAVLPMLEAVYRPHFPNLVYCVRHKIDEKYLEKWRVSVVEISEETTSAVPCTLAASAVNYAVHGTLYISANMLLDSESSTMASHVDSLMWLTGEFDAFSQEMLSACYRRTVRCVHMSRDVLAAIARIIDESTAISERQKTKLRACVGKLERDPSWVSRKDMFWFADVTLYLPLRLVPRLAHLRDVLSADRDLQRDLLIPLLLECEQLTVNYLRHSTQIDALGTGGAPGGQRADYVLPFPFDKLDSNEDAAKQFCSYIEQFK